MNNDIDPKYLSENTRKKIEEVKQDLINNPVSKIEFLLDWFRANIYLPLVVKVLRIKITFLRFFSTR